MWEHHTVAAELLSVWLLCKSPVTAHPKGNIWDRSGDCGGCMSRVTWHVILLEATFRKLEHCGHKGMNMVSSNTQKKKKAQLVLRSPKCTKTRKYPPLHCTTTIYFCVPLVGSHSWFLPVYLNVIQQWPALLPFCFSMPQFFSLLL